VIWIHRVLIQDLSGFRISGFVTFQIRIYQVSPLIFISLGCSRALSLRAQVHLVPGFSSSKETRGVGRFNTANVLPVVSLAKAPRQTKNEAMQPLVRSNARFRIHLPFKCTRHGLIVPQTRLFGSFPPSHTLAFSPPVHIHPSCASLPPHPRFWVVTRASSRQIHAVPIQTRRKRGLSPRIGRERETGVPGPNSPPGQSRAVRRRYSCTRPYRATPVTGRGIAWEV
jgi:hypothetical protein